MKATLERLQQLTLMLDAARARQRLALHELTVATDTARRLRLEVRLTKEILKQKRQAQRKSKQSSNPVRTSTLKNLHERSARDAHDAER